LAVALVAAAAPSLPVAAPAQGTTSSRGSVLFRIGSEADERWRLDQLLRGASTEGYLLRSAASLTDTLPGEGAELRWAFVLPELIAVHNSALPYSVNDGSLWAGRGWSASVVGGVRGQLRGLRVVVAPTLSWASNRDFELPTDVRAAPPIPPPRSPYAYPWRVHRNSIDYPLRFGPDAVAQVDAGQSALYMHHDRVEYGLSSENQWWGPGIRNALLLSNNAPGFGHAFVRTARPLRTPVGAVEARYLLGGLTESAYFADSPTYRHRSFSALAFTVQPGVAPGLTLGGARAVIAPLVKRGEIPRHLFDVLSSTGRPNARPLSDPSQTPGRDQLLSLFARYVLPGYGFESYVEWGRAEMPASVRDALVAPSHSQGYSMGLQWARADVVKGAALRLQLEHTAVSQGSSFAVTPSGSWYTSRAVLQGFTQRGQVLGAAVGPGGSGQWFGGDLIAHAWTGGVFAGRIRWDDDSYFEIPRPNGSGYCKHDVSLLVGTRGSYRTGAGSAGLSLTLANRLNTFYQNFGECPNNADRVDTRNATLGVTLSPASAR
jgi:hypothetical protein